MKTLNAHELLQNAYLRLCIIHASREVVFQHRAFAEIADDSDWHRTRKGYMGYDKADLLRLDGKVWVIARGEACGSYPAAPYDSEILALRFELKREDGKRKTKAQTRNELSDAVAGSTYFRNSLVYCLANGNLAVGDFSLFSEKMLAILQPEMQRFIAQEAEYNREVILASTLRPPVTKPWSYHAGFADFLAESIETVLKQS